MNFNRLTNRSELMPTIEICHFFVTETMSKAVGREDGEDAMHGPLDRCAVLLESAPCLLGEQNQSFQYRFHNRTYQIKFS